VCVLVCVWDIQNWEGKGVGQFVYFLGLYLISTETERWWRKRFERKSKHTFLVVVVCLHIRGQKITYFRSCCLILGYVLLIGLRIFSNTKWAESCEKFGKKRKNSTGKLTFIQSLVQEIGPFLRFFITF